MELPPIVQGGMGIAVSGWQLASAVSREGQFGVVSGSGIAYTFFRRLQMGDPGGHLREAIAAFPSRKFADRVMHQSFVEGGRGADEKWLTIPMPTWPMDPILTELTILANFAEVHLAKIHGGRGPIALNLLTKIEIATLASLYGAMLAGVDAIFMGAGIPRLIPGVLDAFAQGREATLALNVDGSEAREMRFNPGEFLQATPPILRRPAFFPIVSSDSLATIMLRKSNGKIDGFVVEDHTAGGHNAPPRRNATTNDRGEPVWGDLDRPSLTAFRAMGLPFYVAGGQADSASLQAVRAQGATGIQVGTAFAFCQESGLLPKFKSTVIEAARLSEIDVLSDSQASPTGFPFKVVQISGTLSDPAIYATRRKACEMGYLRTAYQKVDGTLGWRCPAEPAYINKGGSSSAANGRKCLCTALSAAVGFSPSYEPAIITAGHDARHIGRFLRAGENGYSARQVICTILKQNNPAN